MPLINSIELEEINNELKKLEINHGLYGTAIINREGEMLSSRLNGEIDDIKVLGIKLMNIIKAFEAIFLRWLKKDKLFHVTIQFENVQVILFEINENYFLAALLRIENVDFGLILIEMEILIEKLKNILLG
ncbi:MAG: hypothetical protein ACTSYC_04465 [Promethearchaeota archaeon]